MIKYWRFVLSKIDSLSRRERVMVYVCAAAVVIFVAQQMLFRPLALQRSSFATSIAQQKSEIASMENQLVDLQQQRAADPNEVARAKIKQTETEIDKIDRQLRSYRQQLIAPEEMVRVLETMIRRNRDVRVESIRTLAVVPVIDHRKKIGETPSPSETGEAAESMADALTKKLDPSSLFSADDANLYKHGLEISLGGSYFDLVRYLATLEQGTQGVFWGEASLDASAYPQLKLTLRVYTLSLENVFLKL